VTSVRSGAETVRRVLDESAEGPEIRGLYAEEIEAALADSRSVVYIFGEDDAATRWPLLSPIEHHGDYRTEFLLDRYAGREPMFLLTPPSWQTDARFAQALAAARPDLAARRAVVVVEERAEDIDALCAFLGEHLHVKSEDRYVDPRNGSEAADSHFAALLDTTDGGRRPQGPGLIEAFAQAVAAGELEKTPASGTAIYRLDELEALRTPAGATYLQRLVEIYESQFVQLVATHPASQAQTNEQLLGMCADPSTAIVVHTVVGDPAAACFFVERISACEWLREDFYRREFPGERVVYFPGIVTDVKRKGRVFSAPIARFLVDVGYRAASRYRIVFQCTNISEEYVPTIVRRFVSAASGVEVEVVPLWRFVFRALLL
jgi:hypothetical protein